MFGWVFWYLNLEIGALWCSCFGYEVEIMIEVLHICTSLIIAWWWGRAPGDEMGNCEVIVAVMIET